jgi:hypothetical protein
MNTASVAPTTESAPFMPQAHGISCGWVSDSSRTPAGSGTPISMPAGNISATAVSKRIGSGHAIAT